MDKRTREELLRKYCGELNEDDAIDPRDYFKPARPIDKQTKKAKQLCRQVAETLEMVLSGETRDEILSCLHVVNVIPAPDSSRLLVTLQPDFADHQFQLGEIEERLTRHQGRLRTEVAASIHRKKTPILAFNVIQNLSS